MKIPTFTKELARIEEAMESLHRELTELKRTTPVDEEKLARLEADLAALQDRLAFLTPGKGGL
jgi:hypothetical protein